MLFCVLALFTLDFSTGSRRFFFSVIFFSRGENHCIQIHISRVRETERMSEDGCDCDYVHRVCVFSFAFRAKRDR